NLQAGSSLFVDGPHGTFTCIGDDCGPYLFISGGSGITPAMSISRWLGDTTPDRDIRLVLFARPPDDLKSPADLKRMDDRIPGFRCDFGCRRAEEGSGWTGRVGRIDPELLTEMVPDLKSRSAYLCGPPPFMDATREILERLGFRMERFHQEIFGGVPRRDAKA